MKKLIILVLILFLISSCGGNSSSDNSDNPSPSRNFYMGFTPWLHDASSWDYFIDTYNKINANGDIVAHHIQTGIPWQEAYSSTAYHDNVEGDIADRLSYTENGKVIYLSIDCLNGTRDDLVPYWGENFNEPLSDHPPWDTYNFSSPQIIQAYSNFAIDLISRFNPKYFNYATEIGELILNDADKFEQFKIFAAGVYTNLKAAYPSLPLLVSVAFKNPDSADAATIETRMAEISDYYDMLGISTYGYIFFDLLADGGNPAYLQPAWLSQAQQIAGVKPMAITETAWLAEDYSLGEPYNFTITGTTDFQNDYLDKLFLESNDLDIEFIIWFSIVDYDAWQAVYGNEVSRIWQDTGLYDENLYERPALATWQNWLSRTRK